MRIKLYDAFQIMHDDNNFNFFAMAASPLQAVGIDAYILYLRAHNVDVKGYIFLFSEYKEATNILSEKNFVHKNDPKIQIFDVEVDYDSEGKTSYGKIKLIFKRLGSGIYNFLKVPWHFAKNTYIYIYSLAALHRTGKRLVYITWPSEISTFIIHAIAKLDREIAMNFNISYDGAGNIQKKNTHINPMTRILEKSRNVKKFAFIYFSREHNKLVIDKEVARYYKEVFRLSGSNEENQEIIKLYDGKVILISECLMEDKCIAHNEDMLIYDDLMRILEKYSIKAILRPHHRELNQERYSKYKSRNLFIDSSASRKITIEAAIANLKVKPHFVLSTFSSALYHIKIFFNIPAISSAKLFMQYNISEKFAKSLERYIDTYEGIVDFPENWEEVEILIKKYADLQ